MKQENKYVKAFGKNKITRSLFRFTFFGLLVHWALQGILIMDRTEKAFKICLDVINTLIFSLILSKWLPFEIAILFGFLIAHTINFLFNAQLWTVLRIYGYTYYSKEAFDQYKHQLEERILNEPSISFAAAYGSLARGDGWSQTSDLDLRLIRKRGWLNGWHACFFVMGERSRSLFARFPIDIYILDSSKPLERMRKDESPIKIK